MQVSAEFKPNHRVLDQFIKWIEQPQFDQRHATNWGKLYRNNPEAAMCEAYFWAVMHDCGVDVEPNPNITPDFVCRKGDNRFYVEVTCVQIDTATRKTNLEPLPDQTATSYQSLNEAILGETKNKTSKCANLDAPCIVAIGTFHYQASVLGVRKRFMEWLHTDPCIGMTFDVKAGRIIGEPYQLARRHKSVFVQLFGDGRLAHVRRPISALLVGGFGCEPVRLFGLLNPTPARAFDPQLLERIPFCIEKTDLSKASVSIEWIQTRKDEEDAPFGDDDLPP